MSTINLHLDKPYFVAGEVITGKVIIASSAPVKANEVRIKWKGFERTRVAYTDTETVHVNGQTTVRMVPRVAKEEKVFFNTKQNVGYFPDGYVQPGTYEFPLQFQVPHDLPGVFSYKDGSITAAIIYKAKVLLENHGKDIAKDKKQIVMVPSCTKFTKPIHVANEKGFLLAKGKLKMSVEMEKDIFATHECIPIKVHVNNETKKDVVALKVKLMQDVKVICKHRRETKTIEVFRQTFPGVKGKSTLTDVLKFMLNPNVYPSTEGSLIKSNYHLDIECDVKMAIDLEVHPAITLVLMPAMNQQINLYRDLHQGCWAEH